MVQFIQEYKDARGLWPIKIVILGPPASGKTTIAQKVAEYYQIHYLELDEVVAQAIADLVNSSLNKEQRVNRQLVEEEEANNEADSEALKDIKETLKNNNGKLPPAQCIGFVREKLRSMACRNQGYILDGCPLNLEEANEIFKRNI
jgi:adenylate kinase